MARFVFIHCQHSVTYWDVTLPHAFSGLERLLLSMFQYQSTGYLLIVKYYVASHCIPTRCYRQPKSWMAAHRQILWTTKATKTLTGAQICMLLPQTDLASQNFLILKSPSSHSMDSMEPCIECTYFIWPRQVCSCSSTTLYKSNHYTYTNVKMVWTLFCAYQDSRQGKGL